MNGSVQAADGGASPHVSQAPPRWLIYSTVALALICLLMAVAETTLWIHFIVDRGEAISLVGLGFILIAGIALHRSHRLWRSLPLVLPWVLYPVVTQGDQLIDNLTINQMRAITTGILALMFGAPVVVIVMAAVQALAPSPTGVARARGWTRLVPGLALIERGQVREGATALALLLLLLELFVAHYYLGTLMVVTLIVMAAGVLVWSERAGHVPPEQHHAPGASRDRAALVILCAAVALSFGLYIGFKNRPGAYQGSPHAFHDPSQTDAVYPAAVVPVGAGEAIAPPPEVAAAAREALNGYGAALEELLAAYYVMDRNYNYWFHNELFVRGTPVLPEFRARSLARIEHARTAALAADARVAQALPALPADHPLRGLLQEAKTYTAFSLRRARVLETMSAGFETTKAGLQHATHIYEGEGKMLGTVLAQAMAKHESALRVPALAPVTEPFLGAVRRIEVAYANRIVGF